MEVRLKAEGNRIPPEGGTTNLNSPAESVMRAYPGRAPASIKLFKAEGRPSPFGEFLPQAFKP
jgi:hypothetical protein